MQDHTEQPLSFFQRARLLFECLPFLFMLAALIFSVTILDNITGAPPPIALPLFLGFVTLVTGWDAIRRLHDFMSGVAQVREDRLLRSWRARGSRGTGQFYGQFEQLGRMRMRPSAHFQSSNGARYQVIYSPASKIVWSLEKIGYRG